MIKREAMDEAIYALDAEDIPGVLDTLIRCGKDPEVDEGKCKRVLHQINSLAESKGLEVPYVETGSVESDINGYLQD